MRPVTDYGIRLTRILLLFNAIGILLISSFTSAAILDASITTSQNDIGLNKSIANSNEGVKTSINVKNELISGHGRSRQLWAWGSERNEMQVEHNGNRMGIGGGSGYQMSGTHPGDMMGQMHETLTQFVQEPMKPMKFQGHTNIFDFGMPQSHNGGQPQGITGSPRPQYGPPQGGMGYPGGQSQPDSGTLQGGGYPQGGQGAPTLGSGIQPESEVENLGHDYEQNLGTGNGDVQPAQLQGPSGQGQLQPQPTQGSTGNSIVDALLGKYEALFPSAAQLSPTSLNANFSSLLPDLSSITSKCPKDSFFYSFCPNHQMAVMETKTMLQGAKTASDMLDMAQALGQNPQIHPQLWFYALSTCVFSHPELQHIPKLSPVQALPSLYLHAEVLKAARGVSTGNGQSRVKRQASGCVTVDGSLGVDNGPENALWYFRESIGINAHHWYYHTAYPFQDTTRRDRHGELFYYMHHSMQARYNAERFANGFSIEVPIAPLTRGTRLVAYNPHLNDDNTGQSWTPRPEGPFADAMHLNDPGVGRNILIGTDLLTARDRILAAIQDGFVISNSTNQQISLLNLQGVDLLGDIVQSNAWSVNPDYYGAGSTAGLHNNGHLIIAYLADPLYRTQTPPGVMADSAPAMRDILFYRWHAFMGQIFQAHKASLPPYQPVGGELPLLWNGIQITSISVQPTNGQGQPNLLRTFWTQQTITLGRGLDFRTRENGATLPICVQQIDHEPFSFRITINKDPQVQATAATLRIFMAPRFDEQGNRISMTQQRLLFFVLDTFTVQLNPGQNTVVRRSVDSTLTIPADQAYAQINRGVATPYCGCGWPQNHLIPRGTAQGQVFDLFVMATNALEDAVQQTTSQESSGCLAAYLYCGLANQRYPDAKPMGYPFDRLPHSNGGQRVSTIEEYAQNIPNIGLTQISIQFTDQ